MKPGDLVTDKRHSRIGIVIEIFGDLDPLNPWFRVRWTAPFLGSEWCKGAGLQYAKDVSGSLSSSAPKGP